MRMSNIAIAAALLCTAGAGSAQLLGGQVGAGVGVNPPAIGSAVDGVARSADQAIGDVKDAAKQTPTVSVEANVSTRVDRGTRCYYQPDNYYYDPVYRDGSYYCERRSSGVEAGAAVRTP